MEALKYLKKIQGQFAFAAYDIHRKKVLIARDPLGICPLYYTIHDGQMILGSTVKAIIDLKRIQRAVDHQAVYDFFVMYSIGRGKTLFKDIFYLRSGFYFSFKVNEKPIRERFYTLNGDSLKPNMDLSETQWVKAVRQNLMTAVERCMLGDKEVGVYLSGGIDSVTVMALIRKVFPNRVVKTFSAGFKHVISGETIGELDAAGKIAGVYDTDHHEIIISAEDLVGDIGTFELPASSILNTVFRRLAKTAADSGVQVALSGEGSDELFFGYDHFMAAVGFMDPEYSWLSKQYRLRNQYADQLNPDTAVLEDLFLGGGVDIDLDINIKNTFRVNDTIQTVRNLVEGLRSEIVHSNHTIEIDKQMIYVDFSQKFPENFMRRAEGPSMGEGVEMRFPFLWDDLIRLMYRMPMSVRIGDGTFKYILRKSMKGLIPEEVIKRPKTPFGIPASRGYYYKDTRSVFQKPALKHLYWRYHERLSDSLLDGSYRYENIFVNGFVERLVKRQEDYEEAYFNVLLWQLWHFAEWYENWMHN